MLFSEVLLEQGVDLELPISMDELLGILDDEIPSIPIDGKRYHIDSVNRASFGKQWQINVNITDDESINSGVAIIQLMAQDENMVLFSVPPRTDLVGFEFDPKGQMYGRMVFSMLNAFQERGLLDLPGRLPIE